MSKQIDPSQAASWSKKELEQNLRHLAALDRRGEIQQIRDVLGDDSIDKFLADVPTDEVEEVAEGDYSTWTVDELKAELSTRELPVSGNKSELITRLEESDEAEAE